jgi:hypothetical protein
MQAKPQDAKRRGEAGFANFGGRVIESWRRSQPMIDTIAALIVPPQSLPDHLFTGGSIQSDFGDTLAQARLWRNAAKDAPYEPRVTYWRDYGTREGAKLSDVKPRTYVGEDGEIREDCGLLKIEFSVSKLLGLSPLVNVTDADVQQALDTATQFVTRTFGTLPDVREWLCQRVDYCWNWEVGHYLSAYMSVLDKLRLKACSRHPFEATGGVVWKSKSMKGRWVKFYNKSKESGQTSSSGEVLRFEVSNYSKACVYMSKHWFGLARRLVGEMVRPARALYVMSRQWDELGLGNDDDYGHRELLDVRLRDAFGLRHLPRASYALQMIERYGVRCYADDNQYMSKTSYYRWRKLLSQAGLLRHVHDETYAPDLRALSSLHLPIHMLFKYELNDEKKRQNLEQISTAPQDEPSKNFWKMAALALNLSENVPVSRYLEARIGQAFDVGRVPSPTQSTCTDAPFAEGETAGTGVHGGKFDGGEGYRVSVRDGGRSAVKPARRVVAVGTGGSR